MVKIVRIFMVLLLIPVSIFLLPDRSGGETLFSADGLAINSWHVHYSFHRFEVDTPGKGHVSLSKATPEKDIRNGLLIFNEKIILLKSFLNGDNVFFEQEVTLQTVNRLHLFLWGTPGASVGLAINATANPLPPMIIAFSANPSGIFPDETSRLAWETENADRVSIDNTIGDVPAIGFVDVSPQETTTYTITAEGPGGITAQTAIVSVTWPLPQASLTADPTSITIGDDTVLSWHSEYGQSCILEPDIGPIDATGSIRVSPVETTTYTMTVTGPGGTATATATIAVSDPTDPPVVQLTADPFTITPGGAALLSWTSSGADNAYLNGGIGTVPVSGTITVYPEHTTTYTLSVAGQTGAADARVTVSVTGSPEPLPEGTFGKSYEDMVPYDATVDAYDTDRFSIVTGQVQDIDGFYLEDVSVSIHGHPEYGTCHTDADGRYALPVDGGGTLTLIYQKPGFIRSQRQVVVPWNDIAIAKNLQLVALDTESTTINFDGNPGTIITHESTVVSDEFGSRSCTMVFSGTNRAYLVDQDGNDVHQLSAVTVRATEFPTPASMPAVLPPVSAYTYCVELSVDGAEHVRFDQPVVAWIDNFIGFDVGDIVPVGYYDRGQGAWVPWDNGVVVKLLDTDLDGVVDALDADGDDEPDDLNADGGFADDVAGLENPERYRPGTTFWKVSMDHFTPFDCNWPFDVPEDACSPNPAAAPNADAQLSNDRDCRTYNNSFVEDRGRIFQEDIPVPGTPVSLHYAGSRTTGYRNHIRVPASGSAVPASLVEIIVEAGIAGKVMQQVLPAQPEQAVEFEWDGTDAFGREVIGTVAAHIRIGFVYPAVYSTATQENRRAFAKPGISPTSNEVRGQITLWMDCGLLPVHAYRGTIAKGWTLSPHHRINPSHPGYMHKGDGTILNTDVSRVIDTLAAFDGNIVSVAVDPAGAVYAATTSRVYRLYPDGGLTVVAGTGNAGFAGDNGPATEAEFKTITKIETDDAGALYIVDSLNFRIRKVNPAGIITTIAGNGVSAVSGDDGPATDASFLAPKAITLDDSGNLYVIDDDLVRQIDPAGIITTIAGGGDQRIDGFSAGEFKFNRPSDIAVDAKGNLYVAEYYDGTCGWVTWARVLKIDKTGMVSTAAGGGCHTPNALGTIYGITVDMTDTLYIAHCYAYDYNYNWGTYNHFVTKISPEGTNILVAGKRRPPDNIYRYFGYSGDGGAATQALLNLPTDVAVAASGIVYIADKANRRCRMVAPPRTFIARMAAGDLYFPEENGTGHIFSSDGLHMQTIDLDTGRTLLAFEYNEDNHLTCMRDGFDNTTEIEYNGSVPTAIVSPDGLRTALTIDDNNHLTQIVYPGNSTYGFEYTPDGLMTVEYEPAGNRFDHAYDANGRLTDLWDETGGHWRYIRTENPNGDILTEKITAESNVTAYLDHYGLDGKFTSTITDPAGDDIFYEKSGDGLGVKKSLACGMKLAFSYGIDPEYKVKFVKEMTETTPAALEKITLREKAYQDTNSDNIPDLITETVTVNGNPTTVVNNVLQSQKTITSPEGRTITTLYNPNTLVTESISVPGLFNTSYGYDTNGRLTSVDINTRGINLTYNAQGFLESITDGENHTTDYTYDTVGRVTGINRPDTTFIGFTYDDNGNMTVLTTPSGTDHGFGFNQVNLNSSYQTPLSGSYSYVYDKDRRLKQINLPSGNQINHAYVNGRLEQIQTPEGAIDLTYFCGTKVASITKGPESVVYDYDGKLLTSTSLSGALNQSLSYAYNNDFNLTDFTYAGMAQSYSYDNDGLLIGAGDFTITRNAQNGLPEAVAGGPLSLSRNFNGYGEIDSQDMTVSGNSAVQWTLTRNNAGRIIHKTETVAGITGSYTYTYDPLGRLETVTKDSVLVESYGYDPNGTRTSEINTLRGITGRSLSYSDEDHLLTAGAVTYAYDLDGFLSSKTDGSDMTTYDYSSRGELLEVQLPDGRILSYEHDPLGRRIVKRIDGTIVAKYLWQGLTKLLAIYDDSDNLIQRFEYADGRMPVAMAQAGITYYLAYDQVGTIKVVTDASGNTVKQVDYDAFGNIITDTNTTLTIPFGFAGGLRDPDTELVRFGYRDYDPDTGRWTAKDPIFFAGGDTNLYGYVLNDPVNLIDPYGLKTLGEYWVPVEHFLSPFVIGSASIISGAVVGTGGAVLTATSAAAVPETFGLSAVGIPAGVALVAAGEYQVMFGTTIILNHFNNLSGADLPSLSDYSGLFPAFPSIHNDHHEAHTGGPCEK